jgi:hypothetical protein
MFHLPLRLLYGLAALEEDAIGADLDAIAQDLICVIFEDMDPIWLHSMWEIGGSTCADMIEILISLALLKLRSRL